MKLLRRVSKNSIYHLALCARSFIPEHFFSLPQFLIVGAQRSGTSSLYEQLTKHPQIASALCKEVHYFDTHFNKGIAWYKRHFLVKKKSNHAITGEATPYYLPHPLVAKRVKEVLPDIKIIILLRNPIDRAYSQYWHEVNMGAESESFEQALASEASRLDGERAALQQNPQYNSFAYQHYSYQARGVYITQLKEWLNVFPREQLLILNSEQYYADPKKVVQRCWDFLQVPVDMRLPDIHINKQTYPTMDPATREYLREYYEPYNQQLYTALETDFGWN